MQGGDAAWYADGLAKGTAAKDALVAKAKADPALQKCDIGPDEVLLQIREKREAFHGELYAAVKPQIASLYLKKWRENLELGDEDVHQRGGGRRAADPHPRGHARHRRAPRAEARRAVTTAPPAG